MCGSMVPRTWLSVLYHVSCTYDACTPQSACHLSWYISAHCGEPVCLICCCNLYVKGTAKLAFLVKRAHYSILSLTLIPNIVDFSSRCTSIVVAMLADTFFFLIASSDQPHFISKKIVLYTTACTEMHISSVEVVPVSANHIHLS